MWMAVKIALVHVEKSVCRTNDVTDVLALFRSNVIPDFIQKVCQNKLLWQKALCDVTKVYFSLSDMACGSLAFFPSEVWKVKTRHSMLQEAKNKRRTWLNMQFSSWPVEVFFYFLFFRKLLLFWLSYFDHWFILVYTCACALVSHHLENGQEIAFSCVNHRGTEVTLMVQWLLRVVKSSVLV